MSLVSRIAPTRGDSVGLWMLFASGIAIAAVIYTLLIYDQADRNDAMRTQGIMVARGLMRIPLSQLNTEFLQLLSQSQGDNSPAYIVISDTDGQTLNQYAEPGFDIPRAVPEPVDRLMSRQAVVPGQTVEVFELRAPLDADLDNPGSIRIGYVSPAIGLSLSQVPFLATLALPIILLLPLFFWVVKREIKPLSEANLRMAEQMSQEDFRTLDIKASGELNRFIENFNGFMELAKTRISTLEGDQNRLLTSAKVLSYKKSRVETVLESIPEAVLVLDDTGVVTFVNSRIENFLGLTADDLVGHKPDEWCDIPELMIYLSRCSSKRAGNYSSQSIEYVPNHAKKRVVSVKGFPLFSPQDDTDTFGTLVLFRDVTEEVSDRKSHTEFVAHVSHELKTPLNTLSIYSESLLGPPGEDADFRIEAANVIYDEVQRLASLIDNLLNITKIESGTLALDRQRTRIKELLEDVFDVASRSENQRQLEFVLDLPQDFSSIAIDKELLRVALNNLLTNAIKYNKDKGQVRLSASETEDHVEIRVADTGIGIEDEDLEKIFNKFYRSENAAAQARSGHGLGLALARDIVGLHGGNFDVESTINEGSTFILRLPKEKATLAEAVA